MGSENEGNSKELIEILDYFSDYNYLLDGLKAKINNGDIAEEFTRDELSEVIEDVDNEHVFNISPEELVELTNSLFNCYNFHGLEGEEINREVPLESIMLFF